MAETNSKLVPALALLFAAFTTSHLVAQESSVTEALVQPGAGPSKDVVIAMRLKDEFSEKELARIIEAAVKSSGAVCRKADARRIDNDSYESIRQFLLTIKDSEGSLGKSGMMRRAKRSNVWDVTLPDGYNQIEEMEVFVEDKNTQKPKGISLKPVSRSTGEKNPMERLVYLGISAPQLELRADPEWGNLLGAKLKLAAWGEKPAASVDVTFEKEVCFRVSIDGFQGDPSQLFETLGDENRMGQALVGFSAPITLTIGLADFKKAVSGESGQWNGSKFTIGFIPPSRPRVDRVWMLFPLTEAQAKTTRQQVEEQLKSGRETTFDIPKKLREGKFMGYDVEKADTQPNLTEIRPNDPPRWYQVSSDDRFSRTFAFGDVPAWQSSAFKDGPWKAVMYENDLLGPDKVAKTGERRIQKTRSIGEMTGLESEVQISSFVNWTSPDSPFRKGN